MREKRERNWLGAGTELGWPLGSSSGDGHSEARKEGGMWGSLPSPWLQPLGKGSAGRAGRHPPFPA